MDDAGLLRRSRSPLLRPSRLFSERKEPDDAIAIEEVQHAFAAALPILRPAPSSGAPALAAGPEFHEAVLRLVRAHLAVTKPAATRAKPRTPGPAGAVFSALDEAELLADLPVVCSRLSAFAC